MAAAHDFAVVAAIDFGTTYSGYGFSFEEGADIRLNKNWSDHLGYPSYKAPTTVLLDKDKNFKAFGFEAEEKYSELIGEDDPSNDATFHPELFRNFKMALHDKEVNLNSTICSVRGTLHPAIDIFSHALEYLKGHMTSLINKEVPVKLEDELILWVITVPAIWTEKSKQFMREAAWRAGLIEKKMSKRLLIALEPEAASFYCRSIDFTKFRQQFQAASFPKGTKYMILDCGGGTNDMVVHEVVSNIKVKELYAVNGGSNGGNRVNERFEALLQDIFGSDFIAKYKQRCPYEWLKFISKFERAKKMVNNDGESKIKLELPYNFHGMLSNHKPGNSIKSAVDKYSSRALSYRQGHLFISNATVVDLFDVVVKDIIDSVRQVFEAQSSTLDYIFMVGGFSECEFLSESIQSKFSSDTCKVLVPYEAQLAILKGAVQYGFHRDQIESRIARRTYRASCNLSFDDQIHDRAKHFVDEDGEERCDDILCTLISIGESVSLGQCIQESWSLLASQTGICIRFYSLNRLPNEVVEYTTNDDCVEIGHIYISTPDLSGGNSREVILSFTFGETEIHVEGKDVTTENSVETVLDLLSD